MSFAPGDEIVCIRDHSWATNPRGWHVPRKGMHYIVRDIGPGYIDPDHVCIRLVELVNRQTFEGEPNFNIILFRPVRRDAIEQFKRMAASNKPLVEV